MSFFKTLLSHRFHFLLKPQNPLYGTHITNSYFSLSSLFYSTTVTSSPHVEDQIEPEKENEKQEDKKPLLDVTFKEAVGLCEKVENSEGESESESENNELKKRLKELEREVNRLKVDSSGKGKESVKVKERVLKKSKAKDKSLYAVFTNEAGGNERPVEDTVVFKELSPDMEVFVTHLYKEGYFNKANFFPGNKLEFSCFESTYGRDFIKFAAEKFGKDNQEIAKWLSGSDLKQIALFGCPSVAKKNVFAAKRLRKFFEIQEDTVCSKCVLKRSCKYVNQSVWKGDTKNLNLAIVMKVITLYAMESVPRELAVPSEINASVSRVLEEVLKLSKTTS